MIVLMKKNLEHVGINDQCCQRLGRGAVGTISQLVKPRQSKQLSLVGECRIVTIYLFSKVSRLWTNLES